MNLPDVEKESLDGVCSASMAGDAKNCVGVLAGVGGSFFDLIRPEIFKRADKIKSFL